MIRCKGVKPILTRDDIREMKIDIIVLHVFLIRDFSRVMIVADATPLKPTVTYLPKSCIRTLILSVDNLQSFPLEVTSSTIHCTC